MKLLLARIPRCFLLYSKGRILMILLILGAFALQAWTWYYRHPLIATQQQELQKIEALEEELQQLDLKWSEKEAAEVVSRLEEASAELFSGTPDSAIWSDQVDQPDAASTLSIEVVSEEGQAHPQHPDSLVVVPTVWAVKPAVGQPDLKLGELLEFLRDLTTKQGKRMELSDLTVSGDEGALASAQIRFRLWFKAVEPEEPPKGEHQA